MFITQDKEILIENKMVTVLHNILCHIVIKSVKEKSNKIKS